MVKDDLGAETKDTGNNGNIYDDDGRNTFVKRRHLLQSIGATAAIIGPSTYSVKGSNLVKVEKMVYKGEKVYEEVTQDWLDHLHNARDVKNEIREEYLNIEAVNSIGLGRNTNLLFEDGLNGFRIEVGYDDSKEMPHLDDEVNGIEINTYPHEIEKGSGYCSENCENIVEPDPVVGGIAFREQDQSDVCGTLGAMIRQDQATVGITALHLALDDVCEETAGGIFYQYSRDFGAMLSYDRPTDTITVHKENNNYGEASMIREDDGSQYSIEGRYSQTGVCMLTSSTNSDVFKTGISSGTTSFDVRVCEETADLPESCITFRDHGVQSCGDAISGDSGSLVYRKIGGGEIMLISMNTHSFSSNDDEDVLCDITSPSCNDLQDFWGMQGPACYIIEGQYTNLQWDQV